MSKSVDERIVSMRFDNAQFESGIKQSVNSLEKLKQGLNLDGASRGLEQLSQAGRNVSLSGIAEGVDAISSKFSLMGIAGVTALVNITNAAINAGARLLSSFTIDPISQGFREYNLQLSSTQTILANTQERVGKVSQIAVEGIKTAAAASAAAAKEAGENALENFRRAQSKELKEFQKTSDKQRNITDEKYNHEKDALDSSIDKELDALGKAHDAKLELYDKEYMAKLKVYDEEKFNKLKNINEQISGLKNLTKVEKDNLEISEDKQRLTELELKMNTSRTVQQRKDAEEAVNAFKDQLERKATFKNRDTKIDALNVAKDNINAEYSEKTKNLKFEYDQKTKQENELYDLTKTNAKNESEFVLKILKDTYDEEKKLMKEKNDAQREALDERQYQELKNMKTSNEQALKNIELEKDAKIKSLVDIANNTKIKGTSLEEVTAALDELNRYADKTIYNFSEMTDNLGKFTAAGTDLIPAVNAIKGISNLGALSGADKTQVPRAMYQISQALSKGKATLIDWQSVANAGLGGSVFQESLKETARVSGVAIDSIISNAGSFTESLEKGWLTSGIMIDTLSKFTGDMTDAQLKSIGYTDDQVKSIQRLAQSMIDAATTVKTLPQLIDTMREAAASGWAESWKIIFGDLKEAKALFTGISDTLGGFLIGLSEARNAMLRFWKDNGGRQALIDSFANIFNAIVKILSPIKDAFNEIFPPAMGKVLVSVSHTLSYFTKQLIIGDGAAKVIKDTFLVLFSIIKIGLKVVGAALTVFKKLFGYIGSIDFSIFKPLIGGIGTVMDYISLMLKDFNKVFSAANPLLSSFDAIGTKIKEFFSSMSFDFNVDFSGMAKKVMDGLNYVRAAIGNGLKSIIKEFSIFSGIDLSGMTNFVDQYFLQAIPTNAILEGALTTAFSSLSGAYNKLTGFFKTVKDTLSKSESLNHFIKSSGELIEVVAESISKSIDKIVASFKNLNTVDATGPDKVVNKMGVIGTILSGISKLLDYVARASKATAPLVDTISKAFVSGFRKVQEFILKMVSKDNISQVVEVFKTAFLGGLFFTLADFVNTFRKVAKSLKEILDTGKNALKTWQNELRSEMLKNLAVSVGILAVSLLVLSKIDKDKLIGVTGATLALITGLMASLGVFSKYIDPKRFVGVSAAIGMLIGMSVAILVLAHAMEKLSMLNVEQVGIGLYAIGGILLMLVGTLTLLSVFDTKVTKGLSTVALFSLAVYGLAKSVERMGQIKPEVLEQGLKALGLLLAGIIAFILVTGQGKNVASAAFGIGLLAGAMLLLGFALEKISSIPWETFKDGATKMGIMLVGIAAFLLATGGSKQVIQAGIGLGILAGSMMLLAMVLEKISSIPWEIFKDGAKKMGIILLGIVVFLKATGMGYDVIAAATGLVILAGALGILAGILVMLGAVPWPILVVGLLGFVALLAIVGAAGYLLTPVTPIILSLGLAMLAFGAGVLMLAAALLLLAPALAGIALGIVAAAPIIFEAIKILIKGLLDVAEDLIDEVVDTVLKIILAFLNKIADFTPKFMDVGLRIIIGFLNGIKGKITEITIIAVQIILNFLEGIRQELPAIIDMAFKLIITFIEGLADAITNNSEALAKAIYKLIMAIGEQLGKLGDMLVDIGAQMLGYIIQGIKDSAVALGDAVVDSVSGAVDGVKDFLGIKSPSKQAKTVGKQVGTGMVAGLNSMTKEISKSSNNMGKAALDPIAQTSTKLAEMLKSKGFAPTIRPVVDLSNVEKSLTSVFGKTQGIDVQASTTQASTIAAANQNGSNSTNLLNNLPGVNNVDMSKFNIVNNYQVRSDADINKISKDQRVLVDKFMRSKGLPVTR